MNETFSFKNYSVVCSLKEERNLLDKTLYLSVTDNNSKLTYEGTLDVKKLRYTGKAIDMDVIYRIVCLSFRGYHSVEISMDKKDTLQLRFIAVVGACSLYDFVALLDIKAIAMIEKSNKYVGLKYKTKNLKIY
jgi:hypothetical protein